MLDLSTTVESSGLIQRAWALAQDPPAQSIESQELKVEFKEQIIDLENDRIEYRGGVRAQYGVTVILCDTLILDRKKKRGQAKGTVKLIDPEGTIEASDLEFSYGEEIKTGQASQAKIRIDRMQIDAASIEIKGDLWTLKGMRATPSKTRPPEFELRAREVVLTPGKGGKARHLSVSVFGWTLGSVPFITFSLDRRVTGFRLPAIAFQRGQGIGVSWGSTFLLNDQTSVTAKTVSLPKQFPSYTFEIAGSSVAPESMIGRLTTRNDLLERLNDSYFDSILAAKPERETRALRSPRSTWSAGTYWNQATRGRAEDSEQVSKPLDLAYETGGAVGPNAGFLAQLRFQSVRPEARASDVYRAYFQGIFHTGWYAVSNSTSVAARVDADASGQYVYARAAIGVRWSPNSSISLTSGVAQTLEAGSPQFKFDEPFNKQHAFFRGDTQFGPFTLTGLAKYDFDRRDWTSVEYGINLVAGSFEPYLNYRQYPRTLQFGVRLRVQDFFERLSDRQIRRSESGGDGR